MKKILIVPSIVVAIPFVLLAGVNKSALDGTLPSKVDQFYARTGGYVAPPANAKCLLFLDARAEDKPSLSKNCKSAEERLSFAIDCKRIQLNSKECPKKVAFDAKKNGAGAVILFYEKDGDPTLTAFPEDAIVLVNVNALRKDNPTEQWYIRRTMTEFWRAIAFAMAGYVTPGPLGGASMQPIFSLGDFYELRSAGLSPNQITSIQLAKSKLGIFSRKPVAYSRAVGEGWAPAPTNDVQRAIYERLKNPTARFHQDFPSAPIKK